MAGENRIRQKVAIIGTGISGMSAAWLLAQRHEVTVYERAPRLGGHTNTIVVPDHNGTIPVDMGFIVYNEATYPNLIALFKFLGVPTQPSEMSFSVSLDGGKVEYSGSNLGSLFAQKRNLLRPRFWSMLADLQRFYREAPRDLALLDLRTTLGDYLDAHAYGVAFRQDHLLPMASAIWSAPAAEILEFPVASFIRFYENHGLFKLRGRPEWRTVVGGSRSYVERLTRGYADRTRYATCVDAVRRTGNRVEIRDRSGNIQGFDHVVIATHADQALALLEDASAPERDLLGAFRYTRNAAVLHSDPSLMPKRSNVWASWNYLGGQSASKPAAATVTYWMNRLQRIASARPLFVTLNPPRPPRAETLLHTEAYEHPLFDSAAIAAQRNLWSLQGVRNTWFCGAYFGAGFHEDGLQAGLAVAEAIGGLRRPWNVADESGRIALPAAARARPMESVAA